MKIGFFIFLAGFLLVALAGGWLSRGTQLGQARLHLQTKVEDLLPDGSLYTPSTQSFLRGYHWLESIDQATVVVDGSLLATFELIAPVAAETPFLIRNVPVDQLVPRIYYPPASPPDEFDAFNLMMSEYSRNGLSVPVGQPSDTIAHFETALPEQAPWSLTADFEFEPRPHSRPLRFAVINNCLAPGLWEMSATDRAGEIYHSWFDFPAPLYDRLLAVANGLEESFVHQATQWTGRPVTADLARLRAVKESLGRWPIALLADADLGYSTQDGRRKLAKDFVLVGDAGSLRRPSSLRDLTSGPIRVADFVAPGKYALSQRRDFDVSFLAEPLAVEVRRVRPHTRYRNPPRSSDLSAEYVENEINFEQHRIVLGNLPKWLLVPQEDFTLHGFGVGILSPNEPAERRRLLIEKGPAPSFAYLLEEGPIGAPKALNSHERGLEQIFVRTHSAGADPWWEITITSFERIVDLVKYRIEIPPVLHEELRQAAREYITPVFFTYRDDNLR